MVKWKAMRSSVKLLEMSQGLGGHSLANGSVTRSALQEDHFRLCWNTATCLWNRALLRSSQLFCTVPNVKKNTAVAGEVHICCPVRSAVRRWGDAHWASRNPAVLSWQCRVEVQGKLALQSSVAPMVVELAGLRQETSLLLPLASCFLFACYYLQRKPQHGFVYGSAVQCLEPSGYQIQDEFTFSSLENVKLVPPQ